MIASNIFRWIGSLFTDLLFLPFNALRTGDFNWWSANLINWVFMGILLVLFAYWMGQSRKFLKEGTEDKA
ncbi:MAG: hypothetical protein V3V28_00700 [Polaribacter sp.]|uniref:DUF6341 family protein n=1 Tax=Polaribacter sp. TaxID=1920175 RepID=UPI002F352DDA